MGNSESRSLTLPIVLGSTVAALGVMKWYHSTYRFPTNAKPSVGEKPLIGHLLRVLQDPCLHKEMLKDINSANSKTIYFKIPTLPYIVFTAEPNNIEYILKTNFENFPKGPFFHSLFEDLLGDGIFNADGHTWYNQRKSSSPMFATNVLRSHFEVFRERCNDLLQVLQKGCDSNTPIEFYSLFNRFSLECIGEVGFGVRIGCIENENHPFLKAFDSAQEIISERTLNPLWKICKFLGTKSEKKLKACVESMNQFTYDLIKLRRKIVSEQIERGDFDHDKVINTMRKARAIKKESSAVSTPSNISVIMPVNEQTNNLAQSANSSSTLASLSISKNELSIPGKVSSIVSNDSCSSSTSKKHSEAHKDFLSLFIAADPNLSDKELRDSIVSLLIAGRDTSAQTLAWTIWELLQHPDLVEQIREELLSFCTKDKLPTYDEIRTNTPFLTAVIHEVLRLHPPVPRNMKQAINDCTLPDGVFIPKGSLVAYVTWGMARLPELWGEDANEFKPNRWLTMEQMPNNYYYPVFQGGPRECLGRQMALYEIRLALSAIILNYNLKSACDLTKHSYVHSVTHGMSHPLLAHVTKI